MGIGSSGTRWVVVAMCAWVSAAALSGCASTSKTASPGPSDVALPTAPTHRWEVIGTSAEGRPIRAWFGGAGSRRALYIAAIHGDEISTVAPVERLIRHLETHPECVETWEVIAVPTVNPDGVARGTRRNANGIDLNRNFPTDNFRASAIHGGRPGDESETRALIGLIDRYPPDVIVTLHAPVGCVDYDGPARELAERMSRRCGLPVKRLGAKPGSLGSYAGVERAIPTITLELRERRTATASASDGVDAALLEVLSDEATGVAK